MKWRFDFVAILVFIWACVFETVSAQTNALPSVPVRVLLLGDSTVAGFPHEVAPDADRFEAVIQKLLAADTNLPPVEVINKGLGGDTVRDLLASRYDREVASISGMPVDFIFIRYGINDRSHFPQTFTNEFPKAYHELIARLRKDHRGAVITLETPVPFYGPASDQQMNGLIRDVAAADKLPVLDIYARFVKETELQGPHLLTMRCRELKSIPERLRALIPKQSLLYTTSVYVVDNSLDAHFRDAVPGWFDDHHPNIAGYHVIADEIAQYLAPRIKQKLSEKGK